MSETSNLREQSEARSSDGHGHRTALVMPQSTLHLVLHRPIACAKASQARSALVSETLQGFVSDITMRDSSTRQYKSCRMQTLPV